MYRTNRPVTAEAFLDRDAELTRLRKLVSHLRAGEPEWLAIIGPRKVGKTSLILELARTEAGGDLAFVLLDTQSVSPLSLEIFRMLAIRTADVLLGPELSTSLEVAAATGSDYADILDESEAFRALPASLRKALRKLHDTPMDAAFARLCLEIPDRLAGALDVRLLVAIDEFQELATLSAKRHGAEPLPLVRSAWQQHEHVAYVISGSGRTMLEEMVSHAHSPFFQHFDIMQLSRFTTADAIELLRHGAPRGRPIPEALAARAIDAIGTHPFHVQLLGQELVVQDPPYDERSLKQAMQALLFSRDGRLSLYFQNRFDHLVGRSTYLAAVLTALSEGPMRVTDVARAIKARSGDASRYLSRLADALLRSDEGLYRLEDPTFGAWLQWRKPGGTVVPMRILGDEAELQVAGELSRLGFDLVYQSRGSRGAFDLLATRGAQQLGVQVKRSARTLAFTKTEWNRMSQDATELGWRWLVAQVSPDGELTFLDPAKASRGKQIRLTARAAIDNVRAWME